jgi:hypothetical protein
MRSSWVLANSGWEEEMEKVPLYKNATVTTNSDMRLMMMQTKTGSSRILLFKIPRTEKMPVAKKIAQLPTISNRPSSKEEKHQNSNNKRPGHDIHIVLNVDTFVKTWVAKS